jgi:hypothetical protein
MVSFLFFCLKRKRCYEKTFETKRQKREPKVRGLSGSLKENSLPFLHYFFNGQRFARLQAKKEVKNHTTYSQECEKV